jgi:hypothetical protein
VIEFLFCLALFAYFLPTVIAAARGHQNGGLIFLTNLLLGWTLLGWIAALVWAATSVSQRLPRGDIYVPRSSDNPFEDGSTEAVMWDRGIAGRGTKERLWYR